MKKIKTYKKAYFSIMNLKFLKMDSIEIKKTSPNLTKVYFIVC